MIHGEINHVSGASSLKVARCFKDGFVLDGGDYDLRRRYLRLGHYSPEYQDYSLLSPTR